MRDRYGESLAALLAAQKPAKGVSLYSRHVNRPLGRRVAAAAHVLGLSPDQVTTMSGVCTVAAVALIALIHPSPAVGVAVAALLALGFVLDAADGQLARLTSGGSARGELLDHLIDCAAKLAVHAAVLIAFYRFDDAAGALLLLPLAFQTVAVLLFFEGTLVGKLREHPGRAPERQQQAVDDRLTGIGLLPVDHGALCLSFIVWGDYHVFVLTYLVLMLAHAVAFGALTRRWFQELAVDSA